MRDQEKEELNRYILEFQEMILTKAKEDLEKQGQVSPATFILSTMMNVPNTIAPNLLSVRDKRWMTDQDLENNPRQPICMIIPGNLTPTALVGMIPHFFPNKEQGELAIQGIKEQTIGFFKFDPNDKEKIAAKMVDGFMKVTGLSEKDIYAKYIRSMCETVEAEAVLKVDEIYLRRQSFEGEFDRNKIPRNLKDDPLSQEAILVTVETHEYTNMITCIFHRNKQDSKIIDSYEREELKSTKDSQNKVEGRFVGLLPKKSLSENPENVA